MCSLEIKLPPHQTSSICCSKLLLIFLVLVVGACDSGNDDQTSFDVEDCSIPVTEVFDGNVGKDGIPSLLNPELVGANDENAAYLQPESRVIGVVVNGSPVAVPHNILWWHEIVNLDMPGSQVAVTYCPLTGSSITFDRAPHNGATFGVSGLLWRNNLIMYDRNKSESLWPQMLGEAGCGSETGRQMTPYASYEMSWAGWQLLHPDTRVVSNVTGFPRNYTEGSYPYGSYEDPDNANTLFPQFVNDDRPPKERVLGIPVGDGGRLYPFFELDTPEPVAVVNDVVDGRPVVVFWEDASQGAIAYESTLNGVPLTFAGQDGKFIDQETGSIWDQQGRAISGEMAGARLEPVAEAFVAFWFAWKAFYPRSEVWAADETN